MSEISKRGEGRGPVGLIAGELAIVASVAVLAIVAACGGEGRPARDPALVDVVLVTLDTTRADRLGCYGYYRDTTPAIDALAAEGVVFERCLAPVSQTLPSHASLLTGLYPYEHGLLANRTEQSLYLRAPGATSIATAMGELGYETAAFVAAEPVKRAGGLAAGFEVWWEPEEKSVTSDRVVAEALRWLDRPRERPIFLWVHVFDPHLPYEPPAPYDSRFASDETQAAYLAERQVQERNRKFTAGEASNLYDGELRYMDDQLAPLFDALRAREGWDRSVLAITADHGEELLQHFINGHGNMWYVSMHVPFVLKAPGLAPARVDDVVTLADVMPTAIARVPALYERLSAWLELVTGRDALAEGVAPRPVTGQHPAAGAREIGHAIIEGDWRLILDAGRVQLFDLAHDPHELTNVARGHPEIVERMRATLEATLERQRARGAALGAGEQRALDPQRLQGLEALGYTGGDDEEDEH